MARPPDAPADAAGPRAGLSRPLSIALGLAGLVVGLAGLHAASSLFAPAFLALTLVICVHPLMAALIRHRWPSWLAATVCVVVLFVVVLALIGATALSIAKFAQLIADDISPSHDFTGTATDFLDDVGLSSSQIRSALSGIDIGKVFSTASSLLGSILSSLTAVVLLLATALFMVTDAITWPHRMATVDEDHHRIVVALDAFALGVRRYWLVATVFGLIVAAFDTAALFLLGVPLALVWGLLSFLTNYIPNIGFVLGLVPPALLALVEQGVLRAVIVVIVYVVLNVVIQSVIQPRFTGNAVGLNVTASFLSLVLWGFVLGPLGALLALPMSMFVKSLVIDADPRMHWLNAFVASSAAERSATDGDDARRQDGARNARR